MEQPLLLEAFTLTRRWKHLSQDSGQLSTLISFDRTKPDTKYVSSLLPDLGFTRIRIIQWDSLSLLQQTKAADSLP